MASGLCGGRIERISSCLSNISLLTRTMKMVNRIAAVLFDLDGTLVDYDKTFELVWTKKILIAHGIECSRTDLTEIADSQVAEYLDLPVDLREKVLLSWGFSDVRAFLNEWNTEETFCAKEAFLFCYEDVSALQELKKEFGVKIGIVTSAPEVLARKELILLETRIGQGVVDEFTIASYGSGIPMKPAPDSIASSLKRLGVDESKAIYVGNEDVDVDAAINAGVKDVLINRGRVKTKRKASNPVDSLHEIRRILCD